MTTLRKPRVGWYGSLGRWLFHANWSRSWDGWGRIGADGEPQTLIVELKAWKTAKGARVISLTAWRLVLRVGVAA